MLLMMTYNLTIDNIIDLAGDKFTVTDKLYYKKFAYNVTMKNHNMWHGHHLNYSNDPFTDTTRWFDNPGVIAEHRKKFSYHYAKQKRIMQLMDRLDIEYRYRREKNFNLYVNDLRIVKRMLTSMPEEILDITGPKNQEHLDILVGGRKVVVRDKLYYKRFRYKISYYANHEFKEKTFPAIENVLPSLDMDRIKLSSNYYRLRRQQEINKQVQGKHPRWQLMRTVDPWHYISFYFEDEEDLVMFKMLAGGGSKTELEIMLHSELQNDK